MHLKSLRVKNLRNFKDTGHIEIKPINILVGKNSVGKSTFARLFPLIKQSCLEDKTSPILWYGKLVDFGDFKTTLNKYAKKEDFIEFEFILNKKIFEDFLSHIPKNILVKYAQDIKISFKIKEYRSKTYCSELLLYIGENTIAINIDKNKDVEEININGIKHKTVQRDKYAYHVIRQGKILPVFTYAFAYATESKMEERFELTKFLFSNDKNSKEYEDLQEKYTNRIKALFIKDNDDNLLYYLNDLIELCDNHISASVSKLSYSEPLRATAQRFYRRQELAIDEIDPKGINIAMFVDHLSTAEKKSLNKLLKDNFNFSIKAKKDGSHIALVLQEQNALETNLADIGVGYSQLLPLMIQLWAIANKNKKHSRLNDISTSPLYVVEQPELHLHPEYQAKIADVITTMNKEMRKKTSMILETHSPHIITRFCELVEEGELDAADLQILVFEEKEVGDCQIKVATIDETGNLDNWPIGFFQA